MEKSEEAEIAQLKREVSKMKEEERVERLKEQVRCRGRGGWGMVWRGELRLGAERSGQGAGRGERGGRREEGGVLECESLSPRSISHTHTHTNTHIHTHTHTHTHTHRCTN